MQTNNTAIKTGESSGSINIIDTKQKLYARSNGFPPAPLPTITVYICGKVTGEQWHEVQAKFMSAEMDLRRKGFEVMNPVSLVNDENADWKTAMRTCISVLMGCDAIYMLPCWPKSKGAILERYIAGSVGIEIIEAEK